MTVDDAGSILGYYPYRSAKQLDDSGKVVAFAAEECRFDALLRSIALKGWGNVEAQHAAVFDGESDVTVELEGTAVQVPQVTLDDALSDVQDIVRSTSGGW